MSAFYAPVDPGAVEVAPASRAFAHANSEPGFRVQAIPDGNAVHDGDRHPAMLEGDSFFSDVPQRGAFSVDVADRRQATVPYDRPEGFGSVHPIRTSSARWGASRSRSLTAGPGGA